MASGHVAGLQRAQDFRTAEHGIQKRRRDEAQAMVDRYGVGETVYRDASGKRVANPKHTTTNNSNNKPQVKQLNAQEQEALQKGRVQRGQEARRQQEFRDVQASSFARYANDTRLEEQRKDVIREGDPMAAFASRRQRQKKKGKDNKSSKSPAAPSRPVYKGPPAKPNRFGIRPGYRWDGNDRGNGFEDRVLASQFSSKHKKEEAYRWSAADM